MKIDDKSIIHRYIKPQYPQMFEAIFMLKKKYDEESGKGRKGKGRGQMSNSGVWTPCPEELRFHRNNYLYQKSAAKGRDIEFLLSFDEWIKIWMDSGHLPNRGKGSSQYCMSRFDDKGAYAVGNVKIITNCQNEKERKLTESGRERLRQAAKGNKNSVGRVISEETRNKISKALKGRKCGPRPPITEETRLKMRLSHLGKTYNRPHAKWLKYVTQKV